MPEESSSVDFALNEGHLNTLSAIADLLSDIPEPTDSMVQQIRVIREFTARCHGAARLGMTVQILNTEVVRLEGASRFAYISLTSPEAKRFEKFYKRYGLTRSNTTALWIAISELIVLFKKHGPYGYEGLN